MNIWIDADACPNQVKEIIYRASNRLKIHVILVSNHWLTIPSSPFIKQHKVSQGFDIADNYIIEHVLADDLVITADIPLAFDALNKNANVLTPHGERYTLDIIKERLTMRDFMETMRDAGIHTRGKAPFSQKDSQNFANALDKLIKKIFDRQRHCFCQY